MFYTIIEQISSNPRAEQIARQDYMVYTATYLIKGGILMGLVAPILLALIGWTTGMLINLLADQLPVVRKIEPVCCSACQKQMSWLEFIFLEPCKYCGYTRNARSHTIQWLLMISFLSINSWKPDRILAVEALVLLSYFALVFVIDLEHRLILHPVSGAGAVIAFVIGLRLHGPSATMIGGFAGFGIMLVLYFLGELFAQYVAKRRGEPIDEVALGFGDVNLSGILGLLLGWPGISAGLLLAILSGGVISAAFLGYMLLRKRYQAFMALPYAPFLIFAGMVLLFRP
jgi:hypothetical protein